MARLSLVAASMTLCAAALVAEAETPKEVALELAERGEEAFTAGDFEAAFNFYDQAIRVHAHPTYVFNRARASAELGNCEGARADYRMYLSLPELPDEGRAAAQAELDRLDCAPGFKATAAITGVKQPGHSPGPIASAPAPESSRRGWKIAALASGVGTAAIFGLVAYELSRLRDGGHYARQVEAANSSLAEPIVGFNVCDESGLDQPGSEPVRQACDAGKAGALRANIGAWGGLLGIAATSVLVYKGWIASPEKSVQVAPSGPGELGMSASVRF
jgi:tetratricopeptide (TPR) repeat protein